MAFHSSDKPTLRVLSSLAEGADRLAAQAAIELGADLQCPLPFPREEFAADFADSDSRQEFERLLKCASVVFELDGTRTQSEAAYEQAGQTLLAQSDVVLAVWDGTQSGKQGGTSELVKSALRSGVPVIWIHAQQQRPAQLLIRRASGATEVASLDVLPGLLLPALTVVAPNESPDRRAAVEYFADRVPRFDFGRLAAATNRLLHSIYLRRAPRSQTVAASAQHPPAALPASAPEAIPVKDTSDLPGDLAAYFRRADRLGAHFGSLYRGSYVFINVGAAAAVAFAVAPFFWQRPRVYASLELLFIGLVLGVSVLAWSGRWNERWLDYRQLAERLRQLGFLSVLAANGLRSTAPVYWGADGPARRWIDGVYQALVRDIGLPQGTVDQSFLSAMRARLQTAVMEQITYHRTNAELNERIDLSLYRSGTGLFIATLCICVLHVLGLEPTTPWLVLGPSTFPAMGAALYAIRNQGKFARLTRRSAALEREFLELGNTLGANREHPITLAELRRVALAVADTMDAEILDWRFVFRFRPPTRPRGFDLDSDPGCAGG